MGLRLSERLNFRLSETMTVAELKELLAAPPYSLAVNAGTKVMSRDSTDMALDILLESDHVCRQMVLLNVCPKLARVLGGLVAKDAPTANAAEVALPVLLGKLQKVVEQTQDCKVASSKSGTGALRTKECTEPFFVPKDALVVDDSKGLVSIPEDRPLVFVPRRIISAVGRLRGKSRLGSATETTEDIICAC